MRKTAIGLVLGALFGGAAVTASASAADGPPEVTVYKSEFCGCCGGWAEHMRQAGYQVTEKDIEDLDAVKRMFGVPDDLLSCHTATIDGYVFEGHVPASDIARVLEDRPAIRGLATPGMPSDAPGMDAATGTPYDVISFDGAGNTGVFATH